MTFLLSCNSRTRWQHDYFSEIPLAQTYRILILPRVEKELKRLPPKARQQIYDRIQALRDEPRGQNTIKLKERQGYRLRVGDYRIVYTIQDDVLVVTVVRVAHRQDVYK